MRASRVGIVAVMFALSGCAEASRQPRVAAEQPVAPVQSARPAPPAAEPPAPAAGRPALTTEFARVATELGELQNVVGKLAATSRIQEDQIAELQRRLGALESEARVSPAPVPRGFAPAGPSVPSAPRPTSRAVSSPEDLYRTGVEKFKAKQWDAALLVFYDLIAAHPHHNLREEAQLLVADIFYQQGDYRSALAELEALLAALPQGARVPDALLKVGLCHRALGDADRARRAWERVVREFPNSGAARQAGMLLRG